MARADSVQSTLTNGAENDVFGSAVTSAGDVDGDAWTDWVVGAPWASPNGLGGEGAAFVYSGQTGVLLYTLVGDAAGVHLGTSVAGVGDLDGDSRDDLAVGLPSSGPAIIGAARVIAVSGIDGTPLWDDAGITGYGSYVASAGGDLNGDTVPDVLGGGGGLLGNGALRALSGADGSVLWSTTSANKTYGAVRSLGDVNGDTIPDVLVGTYDDLHVVYVLSGADGAELYRVTGQDEGGFGQEFGVSLDALGDLDGDTISDFAVTGCYTPGAPGGSAPCIDDVAVFSGADGAPLYVVDAAVAAFERPYMLPRYVSGGYGDLDGDSKPDFIVGFPLHILGGPRSGSYRIYSGATGALLKTYSRGKWDQTFGYALAPAGDADMDGRTDLLIGAPGLGNGAGSLPGDAQVIVRLNLDNCADADQDGYSPAGGACGPVDCDDTDGRRTPLALEVPLSGIDENCNGNDLCGAADAPGAGGFSVALAAIPLIFAWPILRRRRRA